MTGQIGKTARPLVRAALVGALAAALAIGAQTLARAGGGSKACGLLTAAELEGVLGGKVPGLKGENITAQTGPGPAGKVEAQLCSAETPTAKVLLRWAKAPPTKGQSNVEAEGIKIAKQMGAQVDVKTFGAITCSTMIPPKNLEQYGFNTTCSVVKGNEVAAVEVTANSQKDMVSIDKLRPLAEKMGSRF